MNHFLSKEVICTNIFFYLLTQKFIFLTWIIFIQCQKKCILFLVKLQSQLFYFYYFEMSNKNDSHRSKAKEGLIRIAHSGLVQRDDDGKACGKTQFFRFHTHTHIFFLHSSFLSVCVWVFCLLLFLTHTNMKPKTILSFAIHSFQFQFSFLFALELRMWFFTECEMREKIITTFDLMAKLCGDLFSIYQDFCEVFMWEQTIKSVIIINLYLWVCLSSSTHLHLNLIKWFVRSLRKWS